MRPGTPLPRLELSEAVAKVLLTDAQDRLFFRVDAADGTLIGGDPAVPRAAAGAAPRFFGDRVHGEDVRMVVARMPVGAVPGAPLVQVQVAETLAKRTGLAWEIVLSTLAPQ
ncbi:hypothetical protein FQZ97_1254800 [compost metagenome]